MLSTKSDDANGSAITANDFTKAPASNYYRVAYHKLVIKKMAEHPTTFAARTWDATLMETLKSLHTAVTSKISELTRQLYLIWMESP